MSTQTALDYRTNRDLFSNYHLDEHLPETEAWNEIDEEELQAAYDEIKTLWDEQKSTVERRNESQLEEKFIRPMFRKLGIPFEVEESANETQRRPDYGFFETEADATDAFQRREDGGDFYQNAIAVADAKRWGRKLDTRGEKKRDYENPSHQIDQYLRFTSTTWGVLTNGQKWRLYYKPTSHKLDSYYEVDLPTVLETGNLEEFKYFYLFFRHEAFVPDASGDAFLDDVYEESNLFAQDLGQDLQDNIYDAIVELSEGYLQYPENDLDEDNLSLIHDSSLIYLYRIIFVLYAEAEGRDLLNTNNEIYESQYSLNQLKQEVAEELESGDPKYRDWQDNLHSQLDELFTLIDQGSKSRGIPEKDLYIPAYNGGLFRTDPDESGSKEAQFLANNTVGDEHLARVIELLTRSESSNGAGKIFVDYSSLDVRHLGSIYEGLLEYDLNVAEEPLALDDGEYVVADEGSEVVVERDDVYLTTDSGERKATGSYYTPEYVVEYIVDETLRGKVDEIRRDVVMDEEYQDGGYADEFAERIFDLKILDPAMGSGHFLTNTVDYLARAIITEQNREADEKDGDVINDKHDINWARRKVAQRCIYGVDINPLATELAKVSLWLRTLAAEQPLAFLDHHLKTGNSLVGSDIQDVLVDDDESKTDEGQLTLEQSFAHTRKQALDHVMDRFSELLAIDNETLEDAKEMEDVYQSVQSDPLYQKLLAMANVHTASQFGLNIPSDANKQMAEALRGDSWKDIEGQDWFHSAQAVADNERFFHWELEFPVAFYDTDGGRMKNAGFDAVIGNPPYIPTEQLPDEYREYLTDVFSEVLHRKYDSSIAFLQQSFQLTKLGEGLVGMITPVVWETGENYEPFREYNFISGNVGLRTIINLPFDIFKGAYVDTNISIFSPGERRDIFTAREFDKREDISKSNPLKRGHTKIPTDYLENDPGYKIYFNKEYYELLQRFNQEKFGCLGDHTDACQGIVASFYDYSDSEESKSHLKYREADVYRYEFTTTKEKYIDFSEEDSLREYYTQPRILVRRIVNRDDRLMATYVEEDFVTKKDLNPFIKQTEEYSLKYILASLNSSLHSYLYVMSSALATKDDFRQTTLSELRALPIREIPFEADEREQNAHVEEFINKYQDYMNTNQASPSLPEDPVASHDVLVDLVDSIMELRNERKSINLNLFDYLGNYSEGPKLPDVGFFQPTKSNILDATAEEYEKLQIERTKTEVDDSSLTIYATARYKPEDQDEFKTDTYGYTETEYKEAFTLTNLSDKETALIEEFVPVAVNKAGGFANFRDNATKTSSLIDRLKAMRLPDIDDVADDLDRYIKVKERAEELDEKIEKTDQLIDEIVYDLYDLTDEEIDIVESAVADD